MKRIFFVFFLFLAVLVMLEGCGKDEKSPTSPSMSDTEAPSVFIQDPTTAITYVTTDDTITLSGVASDNVKVVSVTYTTSTGLAGTATGLEKWTIPDIPLEAGDNTIIVTARDKADSTAHDEITITRNHYLAFLGTPQANPLAVYTDTPTDVNIRVSIAPNPHLIPSSVMLVRLNDNNDVAAELTELYDTGDLEYGDDIQGDGVFSTIYRFDESTTGKIKLRVVAKTEETSGEVEGGSAIFLLTVIEELTTSEYEEVLASKDDLVDEFEKQLEDNSVEAALSLANQWLQQQPDVLSSQTVANGIDIEYQSGITSGIRVYQQEPDGSISFRGGETNTPRVDRQIPLEKQTRGRNEYDTSSWTTAYKLLQSNENIILNKNVLIYAPYEDAFAPNNEGPDLVDIFEDSELGFNVVYTRNQECTIAVLNNLTNYGYVIFATHGSEGHEIATGEIVTAESFKAYSAQLKTNQIGVWDQVIIGYDKKVAQRKTIYCVCASFISSLSNSFPNSIIFNNSCESTKNPDLSNAFLNKGAQTYLGYDKTVNSSFAVDMVVDFTEKLVNDLKTTGNSFTQNKNDPKDPNAEWEMTGNDEMHYTLSLINGNFETGDLTGWSRDGDGRVITKLASQSPPEGMFMGIISTGLGFTTDTGEISQSFKVYSGLTTLSFKWNFLSEEFMEWIGSEYQDYFTIIIRPASGQEEIIFSKTIDEFAEEYSLQSVSPEILFDQDGVYMTGWQEFQHDLSEYTDKNITLIFSAGDVGDSIYDSAILLDDITLE